MLGNGWRALLLLSIFLRLAESFGPFSWFENKGISSDIQEKGDRAQENQFQSTFTWLSRSSINNTQLSPVLSRLFSNADRKNDNNLQNSKQKGSKGAPATLVTDGMGAVFGEKGWRRVKSSDNVEISARKIDGSPFKQIRGRSKLDVDADKVLRLFQTSDVGKIREFNPMYADGCDVQRVDSNTKISWSKTHGLAMISPRDFVTYVQFLRTRKGDLLILNQSMDHPKFPEKRGCVRGRMLLGANRVKPLGDNSCEFTFVQHVDTGGSLPSWLMNRLMLSDSVKFIKRIEQAAKNLENEDKIKSKDGIDLRPKLI